MLQLALHKMCEYANIDYETVKWADGTHLLMEWTDEQEESFRQWMINELRTSRLFREAIAKHPNLAKGKFHATKLTNEFIFNYGFRTIT